MPVATSTLEKKKTPVNDLSNFWKILAPRLTVLVTTMDQHGRADVSPFSFVTPVSFDPPLVALSIGINKHSYWAITRKREFVINIPTENLLEKVWTAGEKWHPEISKIQRAGLQTEKSEKVGPPRLTECAASLECYVEDAKKYGDHVLIIGRVVAIKTNPEYVDEHGRLKADIARPPLHIAENLFAFPYVTKEI